MLDVISRFMVSEQLKFRKASWAEACTTSYCNVDCTTVLTREGKLLKLRHFKGWVSEWFKEPVLKTGVRETVPWVRIPPHPPACRTEKSRPHECSRLC
jgi:hypothetical protein